jgi:hypothetical protein
MLSSDDNVKSEEEKNKTKNKRWQLSTGSYNNRDGNFFSYRSIYRSLFPYHFQPSAEAGAILNIFPGPYNKKYR